MQYLDDDGADGVLGLWEWDAYNGGDEKWYVGNVKVCSDRGMRLPTVYETTADDFSSGNSSWYPMSDGTPGYANIGYDPTKGVPAHSSGWTWTASISEDGDVWYDAYWSWSGTADDVEYLDDFDAYVRCVLP